MDDQNKQVKMYEVEDISMKIYKKSLGFYSLLIFIFMGMSTGFYYYFIPNASFNYNKIQESNIPYSSRLQSNSTVQSDIIKLREKEYIQKTAYMWLNTNKTKISLPVYRAMDIVLKEGFERLK